jgi:hypothetical protein
MADFTDSDDNNNGNGSKVDDNDNGDNNKDDSSNDSAGAASSKRGAYNKPLRTEALRQIRKMLVEQGASHYEIMDKLTSASTIPALVVNTLNTKGQR